MALMAPMAATVAMVAVAVMDSPVVCDNILPDAARQALNNSLHGDNVRAGWKFGWKSRSTEDAFSFWHRHFAGYINIAEEANAYDCEPEIADFPLIHDLWFYLSSGPLAGHRLIRCYANGHTYGSDGTVHVDTKLAGSYTSVYYPHRVWSPDWGGETVFFNEDRTDIIACVYPKPNRLVVFDGRIPHVARGVSRLCPVLRVTLMFKTDKPDDDPAGN